jgi:hypothetical protein
MLVHTFLLALLSANGVPQNGFPSWAERTTLVLTNRARADPVAALAGCSAGGSSAACPDATCYTTQPPLVWDYDLNRSARFHMANLVDSSATLQHPSPCLLSSTIGTDYPTNCNGAPACACQGGASVCSCASCSCDVTSSTCVTQPGDRGALFSPYWNGENIAAGYGDPVASMDGWLTEACTWTGVCGYHQCTAGELGHRANILSSFYQIMGAGSVTASSSSSACYPMEWDCQDFGAGSNPTIPKLVAGSHYPNDGSTGLQFWANWYNDSPPIVAAVNVDGTCHAMSVDRGSGGNATYTWTGTVPSGCISYVFVFTDHTGAKTQLPEAGAYQAGCSGDYTTAAPAGCGVVSTTTTGTSSAGTTSATTTTSSSSSGSGGNTSGGGTTGGAGTGGAGIGTAGGTIGGLSDVPLADAGIGTSSGGTSKGGGCSSGGSAGGDAAVFPLLLGGFLLIVFGRRSAARRCACADLH